MLGVAAVCYAAFSFDWTVALSVIARMPVGQFLLFETLLVLLIYAISALRWAVVTGSSGHDARALQIYMYTTVSIAIGQVTPMQVGEALKIRFAQQNGMPIRASTMRLVLERAVDLTVAADLALVGLLQRWSVAPATTALAATVPLAALLFLPGSLMRLRRGFLRSPWTAWLDGAERSLGWSRLSFLILLTILKWIVAALCWQVALRCVGCSIGLADCMLTIGTVSILSMLSLIPGGFGVQEVSLTAILIGLGQAPDIAQAGALAVRLLLPVMVVLGLMHLPGVTWKQLLPLSERS